MQWNVLNCANGDYLTAFILMVFKSGLEEWMEERDALPEREREFCYLRERKSGSESHADWERRRKTKKANYTELNEAKLIRMKKPNEIIFQVLYSN